MHSTCQATSTVKYSVVQTIENVYTLGQYVNWNQADSFGGKKLTNGEGLKGKKEIKRETIKIGLGTFMSKSKAHLCQKQVANC